MRGILKNLADMQKLPDENFPFRNQVLCVFLKIILIQCNILVCSELSQQSVT